MTDEQDSAVAAPKQLAINAEGFLFPTETLAKWIAIPENEPLVIGPLTRSDLDHLLFSTSRISQAIFSVQQAIVHLSHHRIDEADTALRNAANANIEGETHMRKLFFAIMESIIKGRPNG